MGLSELLSDLVTNEPRDDGPDSGADAVIHECRECGTTVSSDTERCPSCGASEIAEYPIE